MTDTLRSESGNRIRTVCSCGNEFTVSPTKRGTYVRCLSCNRETLALEPEERERLEERRQPAVERHVTALALWIAVGGLLLGMAGITYLIEKRPPDRLPSPGLGPVPEALGILLTGGVLLYVSLLVRRCVSRAGTMLLIGSAAILLLAPIGFYYGALPVDPLLLGFLSVPVLALVVLIPDRHRQLFTPAYRDVWNTFRPSVISCFRSYVAWVPLLVMGGAYLILTLV